MTSVIIPRVSELTRVSAASRRTMATSPLTSSLRFWPASRRSVRSLPPPLSPAPGQGAHAPEHGFRRRTDRGRHGAARVGHAPQRGRRAQRPCPCCRQHDLLSAITFTRASPAALTSASFPTPSLALLFLSPRKGIPSSCGSFCGAAHGPSSAAIALGPAPSARPPSSRAHVLPPSARPPRPRARSDPRGRAYPRLSTCLVKA